MTAIPALPDTERRTHTSVAASVGPVNVGFDVYGNSTDYAQWLEVFADGVKLTAVSDWTLDSPSGSLATLARPITDARVTFTTARTATIDIVGADRPRRPTQQVEGQGVPAHAFNQVVTQIIARMRELWDMAKIRTLMGRPGEAVDMTLPSVADRQGKALTFDSDGKPTATALTAVGQAVGNNTVTDAMLVDMGACSVKGRSANSSGDSADISASTNGMMLARLSNALAWATLSTILDAVLGSTQGMILRRGSASWEALALGSSGYFLTSNGTTVVWGAPSATLPRGYIDGGILSNNAGDATNDIDFAAGKFRDSTDTVDITGLAKTKQLDVDFASGAAGSTTGGRYSGAAIANVTYHAFAIAKADGTSDYFFYTGVDPTAVLPTGYVYWRLIMSIFRSGGAIVLFRQIGDHVKWKTPPNVVTLATPGLTANTVVLTSVPTGVKLYARIHLKTPAGATTYLSSLDQDDDAPSTGGTPLASVSDGSNVSVGYTEVWTDTAASIRLRSDTNGSHSLTTIGFVHPRGKDA